MNETKYISSDKHNCNCSMCKELKNKTNRPIKTTRFCVLILLSLTEISPEKQYFSLKNDIHPFIKNHWSLLFQFKQFQKKNWTKSILDAFNHCASIESGKRVIQKSGYYGFKKESFEKVRLKEEKNQIVLFPMTLSSNSLSPSVYNGNQSLNFDVNFEFHLTVEKELEIQLEVLKEQLLCSQRLVNQLPNKEVSSDQSQTQLISEEMMNVIQSHLSFFK